MKDWCELIKGSLDDKYILKYDGNGNLTKIEYYDDKGDTSRVESYDGKGNLLNTTKY